MKPPETPRATMESTATLLSRARVGDREALDALAARYLPVMRRWAHGRLPSFARQRMDTEDLVQVTVLGALEHVKGFEPRHEGAFLMYLRQIAMNRIRDEIRRASRLPAAQTIPDDLTEAGPSPLEDAIGNEALEAYEAALTRLPGKQREAVVLRLELGFTHREVAEALGLPTANAARMLVARALVAVAEVMHERC